MSFQVQYVTYNLLYQLNDDDEDDGDDDDDDDDDDDNGGGDGEGDGDDDDDDDEEEEEEDENCTSEKIKKSPPSLTHTVLLQNGKENIWSKYINVNKILLISQSLNATFGVPLMLFIETIHFFLGIHLRA